MERLMRDVIQMSCEVSIYTYDQFQSNQIDLYFREKIA